MARRRTLTPEFFSDEDISSLPFEARLLYAGLWCYADRDGRLEDRPKYLKAMIFPYDRVDVEKLLSLLANPQVPDRPEKVFVRRYQADGKQLIDIPEFSKHQSPHGTEHSSRLPCFNGTLTVKERLTNGALTETPFMHTTLNPISDPKPMTKDQKGKKPKNVYGEFENVKLTDQEFEKLESRFGKEDAHQKIENLSQYIASNPKGKKYIDHYATILSWAAKDERNGKPPSTIPSPASTLSDHGRYMQKLINRQLAEQAREAEEKASVPASEDGDRA